MSCWFCGGTGEFVDCIDDLCHGQEECIHGDPPGPCPECHGNDEPDDEDFDDAHNYDANDGTEGSG